MREIKFRGKRVDNGEWVYGHYGTSVEEDEIGAGCYFMRTQTELHYISDVTGNPSFLVDHNTVGQYTGLKDKKSVEIYEWDVIDFDDNNELSECWRGLVEFKMNGWQCNDIHESNWMWVEDLQNNNQVEGIVIGNIHDNPELLD